MKKKPKPGPIDLSRVAPELAPMLVPLDALKEDPHNARIHPEDNLAAIRASLERFGQTLPLVARKDGTILAGNGRYATMLAAGWKFAAVLYVNDDEALGAAYSRTDNRTSDLAAWDDARLAATLAALDKEDRDATGFTGRKLDELLALAANRVEAPRPPGEFPEFGSDIPVTHRCPECDYEWS